MAFERADDGIRNTQKAGLLHPAARPGERYRLTTGRIIHAESQGFDSALVAQHHFHEDEGGLPAPFVFLAQAAARTATIRLGAGIVTLPLEDPVRVAEDAAVFDLISGGRLELGVGSGGTPSSFAAFGRDVADKAAIFESDLATLRDAFAGRPLGGQDRLYPAAPQLRTACGRRPSRSQAARAGRAGDGRMCSACSTRASASPSTRAGTPSSRPPSRSLRRRLRAVGLDDLAIADVIHGAAFFNWAVRLILSLDEPTAAEQR